jgi:rubrerythrin
MSEKSTAIEQILRQAIRFEVDAYEFYSKAVEMVKRANIQDVLRDLARQEVVHKERLEALLAGNAEAIIATRKQHQIADLKLAEYLVPQPLDAGATFQDILIVAMHREKSSFEFYTAMAGLSDDQAAKELFDYLAQEELMHKSKVETLYDEVVYKEF